MIDLSVMYTKKQNEILSYISNIDWFMLILHGGVRAGKTTLNNDLFLMELLRVKKQAELDGVETPMYILGAYSSNTLHTNILQEISNDYGIEFKFDRNGNFTLFGVKVITTFTKSVSGIGAIRGMTSYGAYINEGSLANKEVFDEIIKRCSGEGARILVDTNPDHPEHWLKVDYIDKADGKIVVEFNFTVFDNDTLSPRYVENLKATTPTGTMTERGIYGRWSIGEGAVYQDYDPNTMEISPSDLDRNNITEIICGVDWGYEHYGTIVVIGIDGKGNHYVLEEHAYQHKHISEWIDIAKDIQERYGDRIPFYADSARPEYVDAFYYAGLNAMNASKAIVPGITEVATLMKKGMFFVFNHLSKFKNEVNQYVWNAKGDKPIDKNDDVMDAVRYAIYTHKESKGAIY